VISTVAEKEPSSYYSKDWFLHFPKNSMQSNA
jgi:hypothetical protein